MEKISCEIIKDIIPLYIDNIVSSDTKKMVEDHLRTCDSCRQEVETLKKDLVLPIDKSLRLSEADELKGIKKKMRRKKITISVVSIIIAIIIVCTIYSALVMTNKIIPYNSSVVSVEEIDGKLYACYSGDGLAGEVSLDPISINVNGQEKKIVTFYFYETLWSRYIESNLSENGNKKDEIIFCLGEMNDIDEVYYGEFNEESNLDEVISGISELDLIWGE